MKTVQSVTRSTPTCRIQVLVAPEYHPNGAAGRVALTVPSMQRHMSDEGWQVMLGLQEAGYSLYTGGYPDNNVRDIVTESSPGTLIVQDKREWDPSANNLAQPQEKYSNINYLVRRPDIFKLTVLKDAHQRPNYHRNSAEEMGCHAWITYYHPTIVKHLAPYVRLAHLIRTWHSIDPILVPAYSPENRAGCFLSGAISGVYPLRWALLRHLEELEGCQWQAHPGYHNYGSNTPSYLATLGAFKVAICTSSIYGYALRKIVEATVCGCIVITDLPVDDIMPQIDQNLVRVTSSTIPDAVKEVKDLLPQLYSNYSPERQKHFSDLAKSHYDYKSVGYRLALDIELLRLGYAPITS